MYGFDLIRNRCFEGIIVSFLINTFVRKEVFSPAETHHLVLMYSLANILKLNFILFSTQCVRMCNQNFISLEDCVCVWLHAVLNYNFLSSETVLTPQILFSVKV